MFMYLSTPASKQQDELIKQLQDQHFQQYMQQVYQQQLLQQQQQQQQQQQEGNHTAAPITNGESLQTESVNNNSSSVLDGVTPVPTGGEDEEGRFNIGLILVRLNLKISRRAVCDCLYLIFLGVGCQSYLKTDPISH